MLRNFHNSVQIEFLKKSDTFEEGALVGNRRSQFSMKFQRRHLGIVTFLEVSLQ